MRRRYEATLRDDGGMRMAGDKGVKRMGFGPETGRSFAGSAALFVCVIPPKMRFDPCQRPQN